MITYGKVGRRRAGQGDRLVGSQTKKHCSCQSDHLLSAADHSTFYLFLWFWSDMEAVVKVSWSFWFGGPDFLLDGGPSGLLTFSTLTLYFLVRAFGSRPCVLIVGSQFRKANSSDGTSVPPELSPMRIAVWIWMLLIREFNFATNILGSYMLLPI